MSLIGTLTLSIPLEMMDGSPASAENSGWMSRMLQSERPDPALSAPGHRAREEKVVVGQTQVTEDSDGQYLRTDFKKKSWQEVGSSYESMTVRNIGRLEKLS